MPCINLETAVGRLQPPSMLLRTSFDTPAMRATQGERLFTKLETTPFVLSALRSKVYRSMSGVATAVSRLMLPLPYGTTIVLAVTLLLFPSFPSVTVLFTSAIAPMV